MPDERPVPTAELIRRWVSAQDKETEAKRVSNAAHAAHQAALGAAKQAEALLLARFVDEGRVADDGSDSEACSAVRYNGCAIVAEHGKIRRIPLETASVA